MLNFSNNIVQYPRIQLLDICYFYGRICNHSFNPWRLLYTNIWEPWLLSHGKRKKKKENFQCFMITEVVEKSGTYKFLLSISPNGALNITFITWFQFKHSWCNLMLVSMQITWGQSINIVKLITFETAIYWYNSPSHSQFTEKTKKKRSYICSKNCDCPRDWCKCYLNIGGGSWWARAPPSMP